MSSPTNPSHYGSDGVPPPLHRDPPVQLIEVLEGRVGWHEGNIIKYVYRYREKDGLRDLNKALWHLTRLIELEAVRHIHEPESVLCGQPVGLDERVRCNLQRGHGGAHEWARVRGGPYVDPGVAVLKEQL